MGVASAQTSRGGPRRRLLEEEAEVEAGDEEAAEPTAEEIEAEKVRLFDVTLRQ